MATIHHQVWIDAPIERVYAALSTAEGVSSWWDKQTAKQTADGLILEHSPGPLHGVVQMKVLQLLPAKRVEWECISTHPDNTPAYWWTGTQFLFALSTRGEHKPAATEWAKAIPAQTILDFQHTGWAENSSYFGFCSFAWGFVLNNLKQVCESK